MDPRADRRRARARFGGDDPAHPPRPPHGLGAGRLAACRVGVCAARAGAPQHPQGGRGLGHRTHRREVRRRRRADAGRRNGRHRDRGVRPPSRPVLVAVHQPSRRRVGWLAGEPDAVPRRGAARNTGPGRRRVRRRAAHGDRRATGERHHDADGSRHPRKVESRAARRLRERDPRQHRGRHRAQRGDPDPRHARRPPPRLRRRRARGGRPAGAPRCQDRRCRHRPSRHPRGQARPRRHDARPARRPAPRAQDRRRARGRDPPVRRCDVLPRSHLPGGRGAVHPQRGDQP